MILIMDMDFWENEMLLGLFEGKLNEDEIQRLKQLFDKMAGYLWIYYQALKNVGFNEKFCLTLVMGYQNIILNNKEKSKKQEDK